MAKRAKTIDMSDERFEEFLQRMATDDALREAMKRDPGATLIGAGFRVGSKSLRKRVTLPSKKEIKDKLDELMRRKREKERIHVPFGWVADDCDEDEDEKPPKPKPPKGRKPAK